MAANCLWHNENFNSSKALSFFLSMCVAISVYVCGHTTKKNYDHHKCYWFLKEIIIWFHFWEAVICSHGSVICSVTHLLSSKHLYSSQLFEFVWGKMENHPSFWPFTPSGVTLVNERQATRSSWKVIRASPARDGLLWGTAVPETCLQASVSHREIRVCPWEAKGSPVPGHRVCVVLALRPHYCFLKLYLLTKPSCLSFFSDSVF